MKSLLFLFAFLSVHASMKEAIDIIFGGKSMGYYFAAFFIAGIAIVLSLLRNSLTRDPHSPVTPFSFSWKFLFFDMSKKIVASLIVMFILFRMLPLDTFALMLGVGFCVSFFLIDIINILIKLSEPVKRFLEVDREQYMNKYKPDDKKD